MQHPCYHATVTPDKIAYRIADTDKAITYAALDRVSNKGAHALRAAGLQQGDRLAILMENRLEFMEICWAAQRSGVYYAAISRYLSPDEIVYIVKDCRAKLLILSDRYTDLVGRLRAGIGPDVRILFVGEPPAGEERWTDLTADQPDTPIADEVLGTDLLYSSGTTGRPKGILRTFEPMPIDTIFPPLMTVLCVQMGKMTSDSVYLSPAPVYHAAPLRFCMMVGTLGGTCVIEERFEPEAFLRHIGEYAVTHTQLVPTMFVRMLKLPQEVRARYDVSTLQSAIHAAAPCPPDVKQQMIDWWGPILIEYYAGSEANGVTIITSDEWLSHRGSVGKSFLGPIRIVGPNGEELPVGEIGDVYFESGLTFQYNNDPEKTSKAFLRAGCSTLGDVGYLDDEGYLYLTDRAAYTIISGGVNIYPQETEDLLICHPDVADVAVFGVPNAEMGEEVKAVVQLRDPGQATLRKAEELIAWSRERLSHLKVPRSIDFRDALPRTPTGKLMKRKLKDEYWRTHQAK